MKKYIKFIIAATVTATAILFLASVLKQVHKRTEAKEIISLVVANREKLAELVTFRYSRDTVIYETRQPSRFMARFNAGPDTVAVFIARPVICAGIDLRKLQYEDITISGDTLYVNLPAPEVLDLYLNHSDITQVYSAWDWKLDDKLGPMAEKTKDGLRRDALQTGILSKAGAQAERSLSAFLSKTTRMTVKARCKQPEQINKTR